MTVSRSWPQLHWAIRVVVIEPRPCSSAPALGIRSAPSLATASDARSSDRLSPVRPWRRAGRLLRHWRWRSGLASARRELRPFQQGDEELRGCTALVRREFRQTLGDQVDPLSHHRRACVAQRRLIGADVQGTAPIAQLDVNPSRDMRAARSLNTALIRRASGWLEPRWAWSEAAVMSRFRCRAAITISVLPPGSSDRPTPSGPCLPPRRC